MRLRLLPLTLLAALGYVVAGCGGSSGGGFVSAPTGGGGQVTDYVGTYTGSLDGTGTTSITVAADGTVSGTRVTTMGRNQTLLGKVNADGALELTIREGDAARLESGFLAVLGGGRASAVTTESGGSDIEDIHGYVLTGGAAATKAPLTTGSAFASIDEGRVSFTGTWTRAGKTGTFQLRVEPSGKASGTWTEDGQPALFSGRLADWAHGPSGHYSLAGEFTFVRTARTLDVRALDIPVLSRPFDKFTGLALDGTGEPYVLSLHVAA